MVRNEVVACRRAISPLPGVLILRHKGGLSVTTLVLLMIVMVIDMMMKKSRAVAVLGEEEDGQDGHEEGEEQ